MGDGQLLKLSGGSTGVHFVIILYNLQMYYVLLLKIYEAFHSNDEKTWGGEAGQLEKLSRIKCNYQHHDHIPK